MSSGKVRWHLKLQGAHELPERGFHPIEKLSFPFTCPPDHRIPDSTANFHLTHESDPKRALLTFGKPSRIYIIRSKIFSPRRNVIQSWGTETARLLRLYRILANL